MAPWHTRVRVDRSRCSRPCGGCYAFGRRDESVSRGASPHAPATEEQAEVAPSGVCPRWTGAVVPEASGRSCSPPEPTPLAQRRGATTGSVVCSTRPSTTTLVSEGASPVSVAQARCCEGARRGGAASDKTLRLRNGSRKGCRSGARWRWGSLLCRNRKNRVLTKPTFGRPRAGLSRRVGARQDLRSFEFFAPQSGASGGLGGRAG